MKFFSLLIPVITKYLQYVGKGKELLRLLEEAGLVQVEPPRDPEEPTVQLRGEVVTTMNTN